MTSGFAFWASVIGVVGCLFGENWTAAAWALVSALGWAGVYTLERKP